MQLQEIVQLLNNKINSLSQARQSAVTAGNMVQVLAIDADLLTTQNTVDQLVFAQQVAVAAQEQAAQDLIQSQAAAEAAASNATS